MRGSWKLGCVDVEAQFISGVRPDNVCICSDGCPADRNDGAVFVMLSSIKFAQSLFFGLSDKIHTSHLLCFQISKVSAPGRSIQKSALP